MKRVTAVGGPFLNQETKK